MDAPDLLHGLLVKVRAHNLFRDTFVVRRARDHSPAAELCEPPLAIFWLRIIAVPLTENHVVVILLFPSIAVVIIAQQAAQYDVLVAIDVGRSADNFTLLGPIVKFVQPNAGLV